MIAFILLKKIISLFLIVAIGVILVKYKVLKSEDSRVLSLLSVYLISPCTIFAAFQVEATAEVRNGLLLAFFAALVVHIGWILVNILLRVPLHLKPVEQASVIYTNAGNLIIPIVITLLGKEWVIYTSAYIAVQLVFMWSHGKSVICGEKKMDWKKVFTNMNMIAAILGMIMFITGIRLPALAYDTVDSIGAMIGPAAMLITGMLIGEVDMKKVMGGFRIWGIVALRLIVFPMFVLVFLKFSGMQGLVENGFEILLITFLASIAPSASTITQVSQIYGKDADYASAINVVTTLSCMLTMPLMVMLYQL